MEALDEVMGYRGISRDVRVSNYVNVMALLDFLGGGLGKGT